MLSSILLVTVVVTLVLAIVLFLIERKTRPSHRDDWDGERIAIGTLRDKYDLQGGREWAQSQASYIHDLLP